MADIPLSEQELGARVRRLRTGRGWSQGELAARMVELGVPWRQSTVAKTEAGDRRIWVNEALALGAVFKFAPGLLLDPSAPESVSYESVNQALEETRRLIESLKKSHDSLERAQRGLSPEPNAALKAELVQEPWPKGSAGKVKVKPATHATVKVKKNPVVGAKVTKAKRTAGARPNVESR